MLTLCCLRRTAQWQLEMHTEGKFREQDATFLSLFERRVGIHGFGAISRELIPLLNPFNVRLSAYSPSVPDEIFSSYGVHKCEAMEELFSTSDVLIELAPDTPKYYHSVTEALLRMLPENGVFVNVGRGATVDEEALIRVAKEGRLQIGLDVYEKEPLPANSPLRGLKNVCLLPHIGGPTIDRRQDAGKLAIGFIRGFIQGQAITEAVSLPEFDRAT
jgi:phosphoglycerate dehydrogenase-like enzyme